MKAYIDKAALVAEMEIKRDRIRKGILSIPLTGRDRTFATFEYEILGKIKDFLDTLEVKEANEVLRTEYEKGRDDVLQATVNWLYDVWPILRLRDDVIDAYKEAMKE